MKDNLKLKIIQYFKKYDSIIIEMVLKNAQPGVIAILEDNEDAIQDGKVVVTKKRINYKMLNVILNNLEKRIFYMTRVVEKGYSLEEIDMLLRNPRLITNIDQLETLGQIDKIRIRPNSATRFINLQEILNFYKLEQNELLRIIEDLSEPEKKLYMSSYGIQTNPITTKDILKNFHITYLKYKTILNKIEIKVNSLIQEEKKLIAQKEKKAKSKKPTKLNEKIVEEKTKIDWKLETLEFILKKYGVNEQEMENALSELPDKNRFMYKCTYGISCPKIDLPKLLKMSQLSFEEYKNMMIQSEKILDEKLEISKPKLESKIISTTKIEKSSKKQLLKHFKDTKEENVLKIIKSKDFQEKYPHYYESICYFYEGENFEKLKDFEKNSEMNSVFLQAVRKIRQIIKINDENLCNDTDTIFGKKRNKEKETRNLKSRVGRSKEKEFLSYFELSDQQIALEIVKSENFQGKYPHYYESICYFYEGKKFEKLKENYISDHNMNVTFGNAKKKIFELIEIMKNSHIHDEESQKFKNNSSLYIKKQVGMTKKQTYLEYFKEADRSIVLKIIKSEEFQLNFPKYYQAICYFYEGEQFEILKVYVPSYEFNNDFLNGKRKIETLVKKIKENKNDDMRLFIASNRRESSFLRYFKEEYRNFVLKVIHSSEFQNKYPKYYGAICYFYEGENFEILKDYENDGKMNQNLRNGIKKIKQLIHKEYQIVEEIIKMKKFSFDCNQLILEKFSITNLELGELYFNHLNEFEQYFEQILIDILLLNPSLYNRMLENPIFLEMMSKYSVEEQKNIYLRINDCVKNVLDSKEQKVKKKKIG